MQGIQAVLREMNVQDDDLIDITQSILAMREELASAVQEMETKNLPAALVLSQNPDAVQMIEMITDHIVEQQGLLEKAMMGEDIYDSLATIKAKIESLVVGADVEVRTLSHITQKMRMCKRSDGLVE
ncbi:MAG: hypothetical protein KBC30_03510 [Planctomycetes bacterium]|jgi:hypothetical protein|nr:hypothetical protein [Planctomycetota bacterium]HQB00158.1 hypothetical protein [Planctomycetota bacterium]HRU51363.1 hypothetical protein [Planctomycetota bacterium]